jgi:hypothetical protein
MWGSASRSRNKFVTSDAYGCPRQTHSATAER